MPNVPYRPGRPPVPAPPAARASRLPKERRLQFRVNVIEEQNWNKAATAAGQSLSDWMRSRLAMAASDGGYAAPETDLGDMQAARMAINAATTKLLALAGPEWSQPVINELNEARARLSAAIDRSLARIAHNVGRAPK